MFGISLSAGPLAIDPLNGPSAMKLVRLEAGTQFDTAAPYHRCSILDQDVERTNGLLAEPSF